MRGDFDRADKKSAQPHDVADSRDELKASVGVQQSGIPRLENPSPVNAEAVLSSSPK